MQRSRTLYILTGMSLYATRYAKMSLLTIVQDPFQWNAWVATLGLYCFERQGYGSEWG